MRYRIYGDHTDAATIRAARDPAEYEPPAVMGDDDSLVLLLETDDQDVYRQAARGELDLENPPTAFEDTGG